MADNKIIIEILTDDKGSAKKASLKQQDLQKQVKKTGDQYKETGKQAGNYNKKEKALYQGNLSTAKGFSKMKETMGSGSSGLVGAYATLAANVFAATAAFNALRGAAQVKTLVEGFTFLGNAAGQTSIQIAQGLREITGNAVSLEVALRSSAIALTSGFNTDQIAGLAEVAKNASIALGRNMADSIDRLFRGVAKLEPEILDELGIMVRLDTAVNKYAAQLKKSATELTDFERRQAFLNETLTQGALKYGDLSGRIDPNPYDQLAGAFADLTEKGLNLINNVLTPFLSLLSSNSGALVGGIILFGSTILTTMIPALGQFAQKQAAVAVTAKQMADEQARAGKIQAQNAKIDFVRGKGSAALTTKGDEFARVKDLKKDLKSGKADALSFDKALKQVQNTRKRSQTIAKQNGTAQSSAHIKRMAELEALEAQIVNIQMLENQRGAGAGASALATGQASGQEKVGQSMVMIGGSGALEGFKEARKGFGEFRADQKAGMKEFKKSSGFWKGFGKTVSASFGTASVGARLFGAALMNAIPIIGQVLFFGGLLISFLASFKGKATAAEKAQEKLTETVEKAKEKFEQLAETNELLDETLDKLDESIRAVAISATAMKNEINVTAGVVGEARQNFENLTEAIDNQKISRFDEIMRKVGGGIKFVANGIGNFLIKALDLLFPKLMKLARLLDKVGLIEGIKNFSANLAEGTKNFFADNIAEERANKFAQAIDSASTEITKLKGENILLEKALGDFDPAALYIKYRDAVDQGGKSLHTFEQATDMVNAAFREQTKDIEGASLTLNTISTDIQEVGKVWNKNIDGILNRNAFDKIAKTVEGLGEKLVELDNTGLLTDQQIMDQLSLASAKAGVKLEQFGVSVDTVREALKNNVSPVKLLEDSMNKLADGTRTAKQDQKDLAEEGKKLKEDFANTKALDEYTAKLNNFARTGKMEVGVVDNFKLQVNAAKNALEFAKQEADLKKRQIDQEYALQLFKVQTFKATFAEGSKEFEALGNIEKQINDFKTKQKARIDDGVKTKENQAQMDTLSLISGAGKTGTLGERATVTGNALDLTDEKVKTTAAKLEAIGNATQPMIDSLKALGPEGEAVAMAFSGIMTIADAFAMAGTEGLSTADKIEAVGSVISAMSGILAANSKAQIAEIDNQIEAEKRRDGKSKESLAKIQGFEKKKDAMARKAFEQNKKMQIASAIASTAAGVVGALGDPTVPPTFARLALATLIGGLGLAQVAIIRKQQYQGGVSSSTSIPSSIEVGKRNNKVDVSKGASIGEMAYLRGNRGVGSNANNFTPMGGAAGMRRGYAAGGEGIMVGERGPEIVKPSVPVDVIPNNNIGGGSSNINFTINAVDAAGVQDVLMAQRGNIIGMIREAAHEHGEEFMEPVNIEAY